jgi:CheY-like chemotaxis protein
MTELQRKLHILIVEDEPGDARLTQLALAKSSLAITTSIAADGLEALRFLRREGAPATQPRPDLILLDLKMPGQNGVDFLVAMKNDAQLRDIVVVVLTTSLLDADVVACYQHGAAGYVQKPTDINEFIDAMTRLCHYWFKLVRLPRNPP